MNKSLITNLTELCASHGFKKSGKAFSRCIGDGIYQNITIAMKEYKTVGYKEPVVMFDMLSMFSDLSSYVFSNREQAAQYYTENLVDRSFSKLMDHTSIERPKSFEEEMIIMIEKGVGYLDGILTQEELINRTEELQIIEDGVLKPYYTDLCAPYIMCKQYDKAQRILYSVYTQNWLGFHAKYDYLKRECQYEEYVKKESEYMEERKMIADLIIMIWGRQSDNIEKLLKENLMKNVFLAEKYKVPVSESIYRLMDKKIEIVF